MRSVLAFTFLALALTLAACSSGGGPAVTSKSVVELAPLDPNLSPTPVASPTPDTTSPSPSPTASPTPTATPTPVFCGYQSLYKAWDNTDLQITFPWFVGLWEKRLGENQYATTIDSRGHSVCTFNVRITGDECAGVFDTYAYTWNQRGEIDACGSYLQTYTYSKDANDKLTVCNQRTGVCNDYY